MFFNRLYIYLFVIFLISSCTTIGPTLSYHNWDCGEGITAETKSGTCKLKQIYMHEYSYSGSIQPVNYSEAVPNGQGIIKNSKTGQLIEATYDLGTLQNAKQTLPNGSVFEGRMTEMLTWRDGDYKTSEYTFTGSFYKNKINEGRPFSIKHPWAEIKGSYGSSLTFNFKFGDIPNTKVNKYEWDVLFTADINAIKSISTNETFLKLNKKDLSVSASTLSWNELSDCNSYPKFTAKDKYLESAFARYIIIDDDIDMNKSGLLNFGFDASDKIHSDEEKSQYLIISIKSRDYSRKILSKNNFTSKYVSGQREVYNSNYDTASANVYDAQNRLAQARADEARQEPTENCANNIWACILVESIKAAPMATAKTNYDNALKTLENTPRTLIQDILSEYEVEKLEIEASKSLLVELAFIDIGREKIYTIDYPIELSKTFEVINSPVAETDTNKKRLLEGTSEENEVDNWMNKKVPFKKNIQNILDEILLTDNLKSQRKNKLISYLDELKANTPSKKLDNSKQVTKQSLFTNKDYVIEDSILIVDTLQGMGTGFYVAKDYVITNQHVVENSGVVTLKDFHNQTFTGKVIATDVATDLALISVSEYGKPLEFDKQCSVRRRENVFTVGHPKGFEYSTTRGIVSAIRDMPQPFYSAVGNKKYIQIDAAISSGNSGGPLFNSLEKVIGVNTWGRTDGQSLNFAIHCSEIKNFLSNNGVYVD